MDVAVARVLNACILVAGLYCQSASAHGSDCPGMREMEGLESAADIERAARELRAEIATWVRHDYAVEKAMGASCPKDPEQERQSSGLIQGACRGQGPVHLIDLVKALEDEINWPEQARSELQGGRHSFVGIPGLGDRPDFMMVLGHSWIRSLEGADPETTHFMVSAPFLRMDDSGASGSWPVSPVRGDCAGHQPSLRVYAVEKGRAPRNVTSEVLPPPPTMTAEESQRYGPYIARIQNACDSDIYLETGNLQHVSTMRWSLTDFDPETPIPTSDVRHQGNVGYAHFGFLVWTGSAFEARQRVVRDLWPCSPAASCGGVGDRFVMEAPK